MPEELKLEDGLYGYFYQSDCGMHETYVVYGIKDNIITELHSISTDEESSEDNTLCRMGFLSIESAISFYKKYGEYQRDVTEEEFYLITDY